MFYSQIHCYLFHKFLDHLLFHFYDLGIGPLLTENNNLLFVSFLLIMSSNKCLNYYLIFLIPTDSPNLNLTLLLVVIHKSLFLSLCTLLSYSFSFLLCMILVQALIIIKIYCWCLCFWSADESFTSWSKYWWIISFCLLFWYFESRDFISTWTRLKHFF